MLYRIPSYILIESSPQFVRKFFSTIAFYLVEGAHHNSLYPANKGAGRALQPHHSCQAVPLCIRTSESLGYGSAVTTVRLQYSHASSDTILTVRYNLYKTAAICRNNWSFIQNCFEYAKRCIIATNRAEVDGTRSAHESSSMETHCRDTEKV